MDHFMWMWSNVDVAANFLLKQMHLLATATIIEDEWICNFYLQIYLQRAKLCTYYSFIHHPSLFATWSVLLAVQTHNTHVILATAESEDE